MAAPPVFPDPVFPDPVFLVGVTQRSGTHHLYDLLVRHPGCRPALPTTTWEGSWEDHLLEYADHLAGYADRVRASDRRNDERSHALLLRSLGAGLAGFLRELDPGGDPTARPVTKSPVTEHLELFPVLFDTAPLVLLVRDAHAVVASALHTFGGAPEEWIRRWRDGARRFRRLLDSDPDRVLLVRYEDLVAAPTAVLNRLLPALGLDPAGYDFAGVAGLPVRGSAQLGGGARRVSWQPVPRSADFDPLGRGRWLTPQVAERVRWLAGPELRAFGYPPAAARPSRVRAVGHRARDAAQDARRTGRLLQHLASAGVAAWRRGRS
jgi:hypothetical protein